MASSGNMYSTGDPDRAPVRCTEPTAYAHTGPEAAFAALTGVASGRPQRVVVRCERDEPLPRVPCESIHVPAVARARDTCHLGAQVAEDARGHLRGLAGQVEHVEAVEQAL